MKNFKRVKSRYMFHRMFMFAQPPPPFLPASSILYSIFNHTDYSLIFLLMIRTKVDSSFCRLKFSFRANEFVFQSWWSGFWRQRCGVTRRHSAWRSIFHRNRSALCFKQITGSDKRQHIEITDIHVRLSSYGKNNIVFWVQLINTLGSSLVFLPTRSVYTKQ